MLFLRKVGIFGTAVCGLCIAKSTKLFKFADAKSGDADEEKFADAKDQGLRLKFVQVFFRHGARTPLSVIPNPNNLPELEYQEFNLSRTIESAACVVAGMFGNDSNEHGRTTIFVNSNKDEILYPNDNNCKNLKVWTKQLWENNDIVPGIRHFRCHIQDMLGIPESGHLKLVSLRDVMIAQKKFHMYSCHDTTLIAVLSGLDIFDNQWPPYAADLVFELYEDKEGRHYVKTKYLGMEQYISKCKDAILPLDEFLKLTSHVSVSFDKYNTVCGNNLNDATPV
ncbi:lysophosphatidic acid phosphatase type 6-like [Saccoglossus kowalevskii]